jgi:dynein assembly factor 3
MAEVSTLNKYHNIEVYFHETQKELLCRAFLFLHIIHEQNLNFDQRVELFLDLYGNTLVKEKDA